MHQLYKKFVIAAILLMPAATFAQTVDTAALLEQIRQLQAQLAAQVSSGAGGAAASSGAHCVNLDRSLERGDSGEEISDLQNFLINEGLLEAGSVTGFFGTKTETALKQWQSDHGIDPLGITGPRTRAAMACSAGTGGTTATPIVSSQCPNIEKPAVCSNATAVQLNGCTVGWQCSVSSLPEQTFSATPLSGIVPLVVRFSGIVTSANAGFCPGNFCAATLVFGDGETGAVPLPNREGAAVTYQIMHRYTKGGNFIANLYQGAAGSGAPLVGNGIAINVAAPTTTNPGLPTLAADPNYGNAPLSVSFRVGNTASNANLSIEFGDGTFGSVQPTGAQRFGADHTYGSAGSYTAKLRRTNGAGDSCTSPSCPVLASIGVIVSGGSVATPQLGGAPTTGLVPLTVTLGTNGANASYPGGVILDYGDGASEILCPPYVICGQKTVQHTYTAAGTYSIQMFSPGVGQSTTLRTLSVTASALQPSSLTATTTTGSVPFTVTFTGNGGNKTFAAGAILKYGDDAVETFCQPNEICGEKVKTHTYTDGNQYGAQLIGIDSATASTTLGTVVITATGGPTKIKVTGPTGTMRKGDSVSLSWKVSGTKPTSGTLSFDLYTKAGARIGTILSITNFQSGSATWKVPSSQDKSCTQTQPNGLCGVNIIPGDYYIQPNVSGLSITPQLTTDAQFTITDEPISAGGLTVSISPTTVEYGKQAVIKYRVANPPYQSGVALWLVTPNGTEQGLIAGKLDADTELTPFQWTAGTIVPCVAALFDPMIACTQQIRAIEPGTYHILAKVYSPFSGNFLPTGDAKIHAVATSTAFTIKAAGTGAACTVLDVDMAPGDTDTTTGGQVSKLQQFLAQDTDIYPEGTISGFYGPATRRAVERFQAANGIATAGSPETNGFGAVGPKTRAAIASKCNGSNDYRFRGTPPTGRLPLSVTFSAKLGGDADYFFIDFGDGSVGPFAAADSAACAAISPNPCISGSNRLAKHTYATNGTYVAKLQKNSCVAGATACTNTVTTVATVTIRVTNDVVPPPASCAAITHQLAPDDTDTTTGGDVSRLQQFLAADPALYPEGLVTGFYGPATAAAVRRYQSGSGITPTGSVGPATFEAIRCKGTSSGLFDATPVSGAIPLSVKFTTNKSVTTGSYRIDYGDGNVQWLSSTSTTHSYANNGTYTAQLIESLGNCFGLTGDPLTLCEIGNSHVLATKTITAGTGSSAPTLAVTVSPSSVVRGGILGINWTSSNAPSGAKVRLEVYPSSASDVAGNSDYGLTSGSSQLSPTGSFSWTIPANDSVTVDGGWGGLVMSPGTYRITGKLYTGGTCWGYCASGYDHAIVASSHSSNFTVTAPGTTGGEGGGGGGGGSGTGARITCTTVSSLPAKLVLLLADYTSREYALNTNGVEQTFTDTFRTAPFSGSFYANVTFGDSGQASWSAMQTLQSISGNTMTLRGESTPAGGKASISCTVTWN